MRLSNAQNYAIAAAVQLAVDSSVRLSCKTICQRAEIPERFVMSIMRRLAEANLVEGKLGASGGYLLTQPANAITVLEVVEAVDGRFDHDLNANVPGIDMRAQLLVKSAIEEGVSLFRKRLAAITLAELKSVNDA